MQFDVYYIQQWVRRVDFKSPIIDSMLLDLTLFLSTRVELSRTEPSWDLRCHYIHVACDIMRAVLLLLLFALLEPHNNTRQHNTHTHTPTIVFIYFGLPLSYNTITVSPLSKYILSEWWTFEHQCLHMHKYTCVQMLSNVSAWIE